MTDESGQIEATPTSEEPQAPQEPLQPIQPEAPTEPQVETQTPDELPLTERTKERIQELAQGKRTAEEALAELRQRKSVFDEFMPQQQAPEGFQPQFQPPLLQQYTDNDGNVDINRFDQDQQRYHQTMQMGTQQAVQTAQQVERRMQERDAYTKYPDLNPMSDSHDDDFKQLVAARMAMNWANNKNESLVEVADYISERYAKRQTEESVAKQAVEKYKESQQTRKDQGPMNKGIAPARQEQGLDHLKEVSRKGSPDQQQNALAERLKRAGM